MKPGPILLCLGTLTGGIVLGRRHAPPPPNSNTILQAAAPASEGTALPPTAGIKKLLMIQAMDDYLNWLETAAPEVVLNEISGNFYTDSLRSALAKNRFWKLPPLVRLKALLGPRQDGKSRLPAGTEKLAAETAAKTVLLDRDGCAKLIAASRLTFGMKCSPEIFSILFEKEGWAGLQAFFEKLSPELKLDARPAMLGLLATKDLAAAQHEVSKIVEATERNASAVAVAGQMMAADPSAAFEWLRNHSKNNTDSYEPGAGSYPTGTFLRSLFEKHPEAGKKLLLENQNIFEGIYGLDALRGIFHTWGSKNFAEARDWLEANPLGDQYQSEALSSIYTNRLQSLPAGEVSAFYQSLTREYQEFCAGTMVEKLALDDLPGGLEAFRAGLSGSARERVDDSLRDKFERANSIDRDRILKLLGPDKLISEFSGQDPSADGPESIHADVLANLSESEKQAWVLKQTKIALNVDDVPKAMELLRNSGSNPEETLPHAQVAVALLNENPVTATTWVEALPDGSAKSDSVFNLAANWGKTDLPAATTWVETLPPGGSRDHALEAIVKLHGLYGDSTTALRLTQSIKDENRRLSALAAATRIDWFNNAEVTEQRISQQFPNPAQVRKVVEMIQKGDSLR